MVIKGNEEIVLYNILLVSQVGDNAKLNFAKLLPLNAPKMKTNTNGNIKLKINDCGFLRLAIKLAFVIAPNALD